MNIEELFRTKLDNSELIPSDNVGDQLMRRLSVKEFLHFSPGRFNVYYLGAIVAAAAAAIVLFTTNHETNVKPDNSIIESPVVRDSIPVAESIKIKTITDKHLINTVKPETGKLSAKTTINKKTGTGTQSITPKPVRDTLVNQQIATDKPAKTLAEPATISNKVSLKGPASASINASLVEGCAPLKVKFINNSTSYSSCKWSFGEGGFSSDKNPEWIFDVEGEYKVVLDITGNSGETETASIIITVHPRPQARFDITPEKPVLPDDEVHFLNYSKNALKYRWDFGDRTTSTAFEPDHRYSRYGNYNVRLIATSEYGCSDTTIVRNAFAESGCYIKFPNAFIPGTDGPIGGFYSAKNDENARIFHPTTSGVSEYHLKIFNKQGIEIFESNDINIGWDGYRKGQLCVPGVYIWKVRGTFKNGEPFVQMGDVTILRN
jgi:PKD repeat protein